MVTTKQIKEFRLGRDLKQNHEQDIVFVNNDILVTQGTSGVKQRLKNKLLSFYYSLFAHPGWGGFYQTIVSKPMSPSLLANARTIGKQQFEEEPEVHDVKEFKVRPYAENKVLVTEVTIQFAIDKTTETLKILTDL